MLDVENNWKGDQGGVCPLMMSLKCVLPTAASPESTQCSYAEASNYIRLLAVKPLAVRRADLNAERADGERLLASLHNSTSRLYPLS